LAPEFRVQLNNPEGVALAHIDCESRELAEAWGAHFYGHDRCTWTVQRRMVGPWEDDGPPKRTVAVVESVRVRRPTASAQGGE
jgi:hypothetical protein